MVLNFYRKFQNEASLIFFFERGTTSFLDHIDDAFVWRPTNQQGQQLPLVKFLYGGRIDEIKRLVSEHDPKKEPWGLYVANPS